MRTIPHRELRNNSSRILEEVKNGEIIQVTNHGEVVAVLIPPGSSQFETMRTAGLIRDPVSDEPLNSIPRITGVASSAAIIDELRGDR
jgi:prevent-host-death family protein